jgi:hypothetical protein
MSSINFRLAEESDNDGILELSRRCPQEGMITFFVNRTPRFNTLHRTLDPDAWHFVACRENTIIGLIGVVHFQANVLSVNRKVAYMLDLRLDEAYRSGTTAYRLVKTAVDHLYASDIDIVLANFVTNNNQSLAFTKGRAKIPTALYLGRNRIYNLLPLFSLKTDKRFEVGSLRKEEIPEVVELYQKYSLNFKIAPIVTEERIRKYLDTINGLFPDHFLTARENGKIKAVTALWDEHHYSSYQVLKLTSQINFVNGAIKFLSHFMRTPHPVKIDEPLRQLSLVLYAHDDCLPALNTLFRTVNNLSRGSEYTLITLYSQEKDPVFNALKNFLSVSVHSELYLFAKDPKILELLEQNPAPVLFDLSMIM